MLKNLGGVELLIISALLLLFFGGRKLPELSKGVADSVREFKRAAKE